jgi:putative ABC transport system ATP-binding protein
VGLGARWKSLPSQLSGGQQQRVAIARAIVHDPKVVVCDEPTSALDHVTGHKIMELLREVAIHEDRSLVIVTHDARIFEFGDRIAKMDDGHIVELVENGHRKELAATFLDFPTTLRDEEIVCAKTAKDGE